MEWIIASVMLIIGSTIMYLGIRNLEKGKVPIEIKNLAFFCAPIIPLFIYNKIYGISNIIELKYIVILFFTAIFLSWLGNIASLKSIEYSPNPGFPLMISKSYVIYTLIFSYIFLGSDLSITKFISIIFIIIFSFLIIYNKNKTGKGNDYRWVYYSLYAFFGWGNMALILTYLIHQGLPSTTINIYLHIFVLIFIIFEIIFKKVKFKPKNNNQILNLVIIGLGYIVFQQSMLYGYSVSPNPGYINAANTASIGVITLLSGIIFKDNLNIYKLIGIFGIIVSIIILFII